MSENSKAFLYLLPLIICSALGIVLGFMLSYEDGFLSATIGLVVGLVIGIIVGLIVTQFTDLLFKDDDKPHSINETETKTQNNTYDNSGFEEFRKFLESIREESEKHHKTLECEIGDNFEVIKRNYKRLVKEYHPDSLGSNASESIQKFAKEQSQKLNEAYEYIKKAKSEK